MEVNMKRIIKNITLTTLLLAIPASSYAAFEPNGLGKVFNYTSELIIKNPKATALVIASTFVLYKYRALANKLRSTENKAKNLLKWQKELINTQKDFKSIVIDFNCVRKGAVQRLLIEKAKRLENEGLENALNRLFNKINSTQRPQSTQEVINILDNMEVKPVRTDESIIASLRAENARLNAELAQLKTQAEQHNPAPVQVATTK
jgi:hypothetical protein